MSQELAPCPFCGEGVNLYVDAFDCEDREGTPTRVSCESCGCHGPWEYERDGSQKCVAAWNRRAKPGPATKAIIDKMMVCCLEPRWPDRVGMLDDGKYIEISTHMATSWISVRDFKTFLAEQGAE